MKIGILGATGAVGRQMRDKFQFVFIKAAEYYIGISYIKCKYHHHHRLLFRVSHFYGNVKSSA